MEHLEGAFLRLASRLTCKHWARLERLANDKHSSFLRKLRTKKFYKIVTWSRPKFRRSRKLVVEVFSGRFENRFALQPVHFPLFLTRPTKKEDHIEWKTRWNRRPSVNVI